MWIFAGFTSHSSWSSWPEHRRRHATLRLAKRNPPLEPARPRYPLRLPGAQTPTPAWKGACSLEVVAGTLNRDRILAAVEVPMEVRLVA